jgi:hypothetical protein
MHHFIEIRNRRKKACFIDEGRPPVANRSNYNYTPTQGALYMRQPAQQRAQAQINVDHVLILLFFVVIPVIGLLSWPLRGLLWLLLILISGALTLLWLRKAFTPRGRLVMTALYVPFAVLALVGLLSSGSGDRKQLPAVNNAPIATISINGVQNVVPALLSTQVDAGGFGQDSTVAGLLNGGASDADAGSPGVRGGESACEQVLRQFLECWRTDLITNMVPLTPPAWQSEVSSSQKISAEQDLFWKFSGRKLDSYEIEGEASGTDSDTSRTINVLADVIMREEHRYFRYNALMLQQNGKWYVDPRSVVAGTRVEAASANDASVVQNDPTPQPTATPKPTPNKKTKLYWNKNGGKYYHSDPNCPSVEKKYLPLASFTYGNISKSPYSKLLPCGKCDAPARPSK